MQGRGKGSTLMCNTTKVCVWEEGDSEEGVQPEGPWLALMSSPGYGTLAGAAYAVCCSWLLGSRTALAYSISNGNW